MKKNSYTKPLLILALSVVSLTGCKSFEELTYNLDTAITDAGSNYTINATDYTGTTTSLVIGNSFIARHEVGKKAKGYVYLKSDSKSIHQFSYTDDENSSVEFGIREDITLNAFSNLQKLSSYLDQSSFEIKAKGVYYVNDSSLIENFLEFVYGRETQMLTSSFGSDGMTIFMNKKNTINKIEIYGYSTAIADYPEDWAKKNLWITMTVSDVQSSTDTKLESIIHSSTYKPTPEYSYLKYKYQGNSKARYEGESFDFIGFTVTSIFGENGKDGITVCDETGLGFYISGNDIDALKTGDNNDPFRIGQQVDFSGTVIFDRGAIKLKSITKVSIQEKNISVLPIAIDSDQYCKMKSENSLYLLNGNLINVDNLLFDYADAENKSIKAHYLVDGQVVQVQILLSENASQTQKDSFISFISQMEENESLSLENVSLLYRSNSPAIYLSNTSSLIKK